MHDGFQASTAVSRQLRTWAPRGANCKATPLPSPSSTPSTMFPNWPFLCTAAPRTTTTGQSARAATARLTAPKSMSAPSPSSLDPRTSAKT
ncbi:hypothetical protein [Streptomyces canus]|uniref:hypothetical protein n=1 Tax=Streptomyces canus TaxID=58343 RepID=UPI002DD7F021|nr:hypothetical protein [Streptomyces canus]